MKRSLYKYCCFVLLLLCFNNNVKAQVGLCPSNLDFEQGNFQGWEGRWGAGNNPLPLPNIGFINGRHTIISQATAGLDPFGFFPTLCPNGSSFSVRLGNSGTGNQAESISYTYSIPAGLSTFSMLFNYAVVLQDPGHVPANQPRFRARIIDVATGGPVNCVDFDFIASSSLPGFVPSPVNPTVFYKDWTPISINLDAYIGQTIRLEFVTNDCTQGGHFGYAYLDVNTNCNGVISGNFICPGDTDLTLTAPYGFQSYAWYGDMAQTQLLSTSQTLYLNPLPAVGSVYPVVVTPYNGFGCTSTLYAVIDVGTTPAADAGPDQIICNNQPVQIGAPPVASYSYSWTPVGQVSNPNIANPVASIITSGPEEFIVLTTDILTGCEAYDTTYLTAGVVDTTMTASGQTTYCMGNGTPGTLTVSNTLLAVQWYDGNTPIAGATGFTYQPTVSGSYWAQVQGIGCLDSTRTVVFTISPVPLSVAGADANICVNQTVQIGGPPLAGVNYSWTPAAQVSDPAIADPQAWVVDATPVQFIVRATDPASGCYSEDTMYITGRVVDTSLAVTGKTNYCTGDPTPGVLTVSNTLAAVQWYDGNTPIAGATGFTYQPTVSGSYWAEVQQVGCTDSTRTITFNIGQTPVSTAGPDASICANSITTLGAPPVPGVNYSWTPVAQVSNPTIADPQAWVNDGTPVEFIVRSTDPASGCYSQDTVYITGRVVDTSLALVGKTVYCTGDPAPGSMTVSNTLVAVQWYDGANPVPGATGFTFQPSVSGNYWAQVQQVGCTDSTRTVAFSIGQTPVSTAGPDASICVNTTIQIGGASSPGVNYSWTPAGQVSNAAISNPQAWVFNGTPVEFIVRSTDIASGCYSQDTLYITGRDVDTTLTVNGSAYCSGDVPGFLTVTNAATAVQWYDGATPIPGATGFNYQPVVSGNYWAQIQQFGCTDSTRTVQFYIHAKPTVSFTPSSDSACITQHSFVFTNNSTNTEGAAMTYLWRFSDGTTQTTLDATKTFLLPGSYTVKLITTTEFGCADSTGFTTVHVMPNGDADFKWDSICINRPSMFYNLSDENGSAQVNYSWNFNNGGPPVTVQHPGLITYTTTGLVDVTLTLTALGCENNAVTVVKKVQANDAKPGTRYRDMTVPEGYKTFIHARDSVGVYFQWMPAVQLSNYNTKYTEFTAINDVLYTIRIGNIHSCITIDTLQMLVLKKPGYYLPTAFTPNGDGLNDVAIPYLVRMKSFVSFSVFDRRGTRIFYSQTDGKGWDGRYNGEPQPNGVYVWMLEFIDNNNQKVIEKGTITIIR